MTILVGQRLFRVTPSRRGSKTMNTDWVRVVKVGRKWADFEASTYLRTGRFNMETLRIDGGGFGDAGSVYVSEQAYYDALRADTLWRELRQRLDRIWTRPEKADELAILKAADALGIKLEGE